MIGEEEIKNNIRCVNESIPSGVTLVAVSKFHPVEALKMAYSAGIRDFGESRAQELCVKVPEMPSDVRWHFIGHLQTNKVRQILPYVSIIHSVDSLKLLKLIDNEAARIGRKVEVLLQLHVAQEDTKFGFTCNECIEIANAGEFANLSNTVIRGVMGMATNTDDEDAIANEFSEIRDVFCRLRNDVFTDDERFNIISMGMSDDYPIAIRQGSTMVRVGTRIFGAREY